jgi:hypothetical protein
MSDISIRMTTKLLGLKHINKMKTFEATKHLPVSYFHVRELVENKILESDWIPGSENDADLATKAVTISVFKKLLPNIMVS